MYVTSVYEFLENIQNQTFVGVDALTLTGKTPLAMLALRGCLVALQDDLITEPKKPFTFQGARGYSQGSLRYAAKEDVYGKTLWGIVMVTGALANKIVSYVDLDLKATRIDFRVDVVLKSPRPDFARKMYEACGKEGSFIESLTGQTFYPVTNRERTYFGRLYDKSPEYGESLGVVWRYEVEIKRKSAASIAQTLLDCHDKTAFIEDTVFGIFEEKWRIPVPKAGIMPTINYVGGHVISPEQKLDWIRRNVAKSVRELKRQGFQAELEELFKAS